MFMHLKKSNLFITTSHFLNHLFLNFLRHLNYIFHLLLLHNKRLNTNFFWLHFPLPLLKISSLRILNGLQNIKLFFDHRLVLFFEVDEWKEFLFGVRRGQIVMGLGKIFLFNVLGCYVPTHLNYSSKTVINWYRKISNI